MDSLWPSMIWIQLRKLIKNKKKKFFRGFLYHIKCKRQINFSSTSLLLVKVEKIYSNPLFLNAEGKPNRKSWTSTQFMWSPKKLSEKDHKATIRNTKMPNQPKGVIVKHRWWLVRIYFKVGFWNGEIANVATQRVGQSEAFVSIC